MALDAEELRSLSPAEKLQLIGWLWDDLNDSVEAIPFPDWIDREAVRRRDEMCNLENRVSYEEMRERISRRNG
ncbi:MAG: addiction module protein [Thermoguttaceae bacterium]